MKRLFFICLFLPILIQAQQYNGIQFQTGLSWQELLAKAKSEYKYIFIQLANDSCKDCDAMSKEVYSLESIGKYFNDEFISLRMRKDSFAALASQNKDLFPYKQVVLKNKATGYPIYLFFSPDGKLVHKGMGRMSPDNFKAIASDALNLSSQYFTQLNKYFSGLKDYPLLAALAISAQEAGDRDTALQIAVDYKKNYLDHLPDSGISTTENIEFIQNFSQLENTGGRVFKLFLDKPELVDRQTEKGFAHSFIRTIINREEIDAKLWKDGKAVTNQPDWDKISNSIQKKSGKNYADELMPTAKMVFYRTELNWKAYVKASEEYYQNKKLKPGDGLSSDSWDLNGRAWDVFLYCNDTFALKAALQWSTLSIELDPVNVQYFDTRANLLYKLGRIDEAIAWEQLAIKHTILDARLRGREKGGFQDDFTSILEKMKKGIPTWNMQ